jgi:CheY-like chemotaxis protein
VGVAIRPHQPLSMVDELLPHLDLLLVMTVQPGFGGQAFMADVVPKIAEARDARQRLGASFRIEVDGGIARDTIAATARAGADTFVAGSAIFGEADREAAARELLALAGGTGARRRRDGIDRPGCDVNRTILVADDDPDIRAFLEITLSLAGFEVREACRRHRHARGRSPRRAGPDPPRRHDAADGRAGGPPEAAQDARTSHIPVVLLTARVQREDTLGGLEAGADDYVTKPFDGDVLLARIRSALRRADQQRSLNPLTGLPGNERILSELSARLARQRRFALLYVDLDQFKPFNDHYGFLRGDEAIRAVAELLRDVARELGDEDTFVGHVGGDDFVVILAPDQAETSRRTSAVGSTRSPRPSTTRPTGPRGPSRSPTAAGCPSATRCCRCRSGSPRPSAGTSPTRARS